MLRRITFATACLLVWCLTAPVEWAQAETLRVSGRVRLPGGTAAQGAVAEVLPLLDSYEEARWLLTGAGVQRGVARTVTDGQGELALQMPSPGVWRVVISAAGWMPVAIVLAPLTEDLRLPDVTLSPDLGTTVQIAAANSSLPARCLLLPRQDPEDARRFAGSWRPWHSPQILPGTERARLPRMQGERLTVDFVAIGFAPVRSSGTGQLSAALLPPLGPARKVVVHDTAGRPMPSVVIETEDGIPLAITDNGGRASIVPRKREGLHLLAPDGGREVVPAGWETAGGDGVAALRCDTNRNSTWSGLILDAVSHLPLTQAVVWDPAAPGAWAVTDGAGWFRLRGSGLENGQLRAAAAGHLSGARRIRDPRQARSSLVIALPPAARLTGAVRTAEGHPVEGATVHASPSQPSDLGRGASEQAATTTPGGAFDLPRLRPQIAYRVSARAEGFAPHEETVLVASPGTNGKPLLIVLSRGRSVFGKATDREGHSIPGAAIQLLPHPTRQQLHEAVIGALRDPRDPLNARDSPTPTTQNIAMQVTTQSDGSFHLTGISPGRFDLVARHEGFAPQVVRELEVPVGTGSLDLGTVLLGPDAAISGTVVDGGGQPVSGASVHLAVTVFEPREHYRLTVGGSSGAQTTGDDGAFRFTSLTPGDLFDLVVVREGFLVARLPKVPAPPRRSLRVVLRPASAVRGRVVTAEGKPVSAARVAVSPAEGPAGIELLSRRGGRDIAGLSEADGRFQVTDVEPGPAILSVVAAGHPPKQQRIVVPDPADAGNEQPMEVILETGVEVTGHVIDEGTNPIPGASVSILGGPATTSGEDGSFVLDGVAPGPHRIVAEDATGAQATRSLVAGTDTDVELVVTGGLLLRGRVRETGGGAVEGAAVLLVSRREGESPRLSLSDAQGRFAFNHLAAGAYDLRASKEGSVGATLSGVEVDAAQQAPAAQMPPLPPDIELVLSPGAVVRGKLLGLDPADFTTVAVGATGPSGLRLGGTVDFSGDYQISGLVPGGWTVRAGVPGSGKAAEAEISPAAGDEELRLDLSFHGDATLAGTVVHQGEPLPGAVLTLTSPDGTVAGIDTSSYQGAYRFNGLKNGTYVLSVATAEGDLQCQERVAVEGDTELAVQLQTVQLTVTVLAQGSSTPLAGATVVLEPETGAGGDLVSQARGAQTDGEGRGTMSRVLRQPYRVQVEAPGFAAATVPFDGTGAPSGSAELTVLVAPAPPVPPVP